MIVLMGESCTGKSSIMKKLVKIDYKNTVSYTVREKRLVEDDIIFKDCEKLANYIMYNTNLNYTVNEIIEKYISARRKI